jgi:hypothetical protein
VVVTAALAEDGPAVLGVGGVLVMLIGLVVCVGIGIAVVLLVAVPALRREGRLQPSDSASPHFRLPREWTGYDDEAYGYFGTDDATSHLATREQAAAGDLAHHSYILYPQPRRHAAPPLATLRPRTRHWKVPKGGTGLRTTLNLLFR